MQNRLKISDFFVYNKKIEKMVWKIFWDKNFKIFVKKRDYFCSILFIFMDDKEYYKWKIFGNSYTHKDFFTTNKWMVIVCICFYIFICINFTYIYATYILCSRRFLVSFFTICIHLCSDFIYKIVVCMSCRHTYKHPCYWFAKQWIDIFYF